MCLSNLIKKHDSVPNVQLSFSGSIATKPFIGCLIMLIRKLPRGWSERLLQRVVRVAPRGWSERRARKSFTTFFDLGGK